MIGAYGLSKITVNKDNSTSINDSIEIFVATNGVHTDIVLPLTNDLIDWKNFVNPEYTKSGYDNYRYVAFGWGDKGFYLETPTWAELKFKTAFKALFFLSSSAMHVSFYRNVKENDGCKSIKVDKNKYMKIIEYVTNSFKLENNSPILIKDASYGINDSFYEATGKYNLFYTCNTWTNNGLKYAGLKGCYWTPFDSEILNKY